MMSYMIVLITGCASTTITNNYCDIVKPHLFKNKETVTWLIENDQQLFIDNLVHNEQIQRICKNN